MLVDAIILKEFTTYFSPKHKLVCSQQFHASEEYVFFGTLLFVMWTEQNYRVCIYWVKL